MATLFLIDREVVNLDLVQDFTIGSEWVRFLNAAGTREHRITLTHLAPVEVVARVLDYYLNGSQTGVITPERFNKQVELYREQAAAKK